MNRAVETLLSTQTIRAQANRMLDHALSGNTSFRVQLDRLPEVSRFVTDVIHSNYPDLKIPFHSRWGHFKVGGVDRVASFDFDAKSLLDLVVVSVLLDAGAGMEWKYQEGSTGQSFSKSEGLAVASLRMFEKGMFSDSENEPFRVSANRLEKFTSEDLEKGFQVSDRNPLVGIEGRVRLMNALGRALKNHSEYFGEVDPRPGNLYDYFLKVQNTEGAVEATTLLRAIQLGFGSIWPGRLELSGIHLGDVWKYDDFGDEWVPFHKLPQWLSYSMIEPLIEAGIRIVGTDQLTGLAEYRNGGLFYDFKVLSLKDENLEKREHRPDSALIIEWRALTLALLEKVAGLIRSELKVSEKEFPLGKILEGGTWHAGRRIASKMRKDGGPPLRLQSDGTVF